MSIPYEGTPRHELTPEQHAERRAAYRALTPDGKAAYRSRAGRATARLHRPDAQPRNLRTSEAHRMLDDTLEKHITLARDSAAKAQARLDALLDERQRRRAVESTP